MPTTAPNTVRVAVGVLHHEGKILLAQRPEGKDFAGLWEFPGGKIEAGESLEAALLRELAEEVNLQLDTHQLSPLLQVTFTYPHKTVSLETLWVEANAAQAQSVKGLEGQAICWVAIADLKNYRLPESNVPIFNKILERLTPNA